MYKVKIADLEPGMKLAKSTTLADGTVLLSEGVVIKEQYISRLEDKNIPAVYVENEEVPNVEQPESVSKGLKDKALTTIKDCLYSIKENEVLSNVKDIKNVSKNLVDELQQNRKAVIHLSDIRAYDEYVFGHSVDVAILSIKTAISMGFNQLDIQKIAIGALLHDIGRTKIDKSILTKPGSLTEEEFAKVKTHSREGFNILKASEEISILSAHIAYQHHEKYNGSGYPRGLKGEEILTGAQITAVADIFDAVTNDRAYRDAVSSLEAVEIIREEEEKGNLNPQVVEKFLENIPVYPVGSIVKLSNGKTGIVTKVDKDNILTPIIRLIKEEGGKKVDSFREVDLSKRDNLRIVDSVSSL
ncbi:HD-GYP domain-containing protein [Fuchsiella alkaliacetigena]|uniref:HD-GYP domain-containing protein n=1 Tax=Fuchsiella alkaliacetigena TaxID=957042 RepID=UPI00200A41E6|nr:HD-GYP domain-containing protein [Fuchsiella alkaliacetigena]MCK8825124.1 HD-GYP domain-containing protein [Fuchsiella alkaliacetigena]